MAFNLKIGVTGDSAAKKQISDIGTELDKVERKGDRFWQSATRGVRAQARETARLKQETGGLIQQLTQVSSMRFEGALGGIGGLKAGLLGLGAAAVGLIASIGDIHRGLMTAGDEMIRLRNRIGTIMPNQGQAAFAMQDTKGIADRAMTDWAPTNELYVRLTNATKELGLGQVDTLRLTESISKGFQLQGATAQEASAGMIQLSQAFASGRLQGDEFRSLSESMPFILDLVANRMGVTRSELKKLSSEGKITAKVLVDAFDDGAGQIDASFARIEKTFEQRMKPLENAALEDPTKMFSNDLYGVKNFLDLSGEERSQTPLGRIADAFNPTGGAADLQRDLLQKQNAEIAQTEVLMKQLALQTEQTRIQFQGLLETQDELSSKKDPWFIKPPPEMKTTVDILREQINGLRALGDPDIGTRVQLMVGQMTQEFLTWGDAVKSIVVVAKENFLDLLPASLTPSIQGFVELLSSISDVNAALGATESVVQAPSGLVNHAFGVVADLLRGQKGAWGSMSDEEIRANMTKRRTGGRVPQREVENAWRSESPISDSLFGPDFANEAQSAFDALKQHVADFNAEWENNPIDSWSDSRGPLEMLSALVDHIKNAKSATEIWNEELRRNELMKSSVEKGLDAVRAQATNVGGAISDAMTGAYQSMENAAVKFFTGQKIGWREMANSIIGDLTRIAIRQGIVGLFGLFGGGGSASVFGTGATQAWGPGLYGGARADGGTFTAPSTGGGTDSIPVMFRMSPGEQATFTPQGQAHGGSASGPVIINRTDPRDLITALDTAAGRQAVVNIIRNNPAAIRAILGR